MKRQARKGAVGAGRELRATGRPWKRWMAVTLGAAILVIFFQTEGSLLTRSFRLFGHLRWGWVIFGIVAESGSMASFARMRRRLLRSGGLRMAIGSVIAITYAGNAISVSLPVAGSPVSTAFAFRQFANHGATRAAAAWTLTMTGIISSTAFALIISVGAMLSGNPAAIAAGVVGAAGTVLPLGAVLMALRRPAWRARLTRVVIAVLARVQGLTRRPAGDLAVVVPAAAAQLGSFRLSRGDAVAASIFAVNNWLLDIVCLACGIKAAGLSVPWTGLILAWAAGAAAASLNLTPGGLGIVEAALAAALVATDLPSTSAMTSVLVYRLISFWLVLGAGWLAYWLVHRTSSSKLVEAAPDELPKSPTVRFPRHETGDDEEAACEV